tara:strand:- start:11 stop:838 length:828 start_codon:yes stop_codon:yes gene_type:complete
MTKKAAVMGWPVDHSLSPKVHGYWLDYYGIDGMYDLYPVSDEGDLFEQHVRSLARNGYSGVNVTIPFKERALLCVDEVTDVARAIGAVNTIIVKQDGLLLGTNTDAFGFIQNILSSIQDFDFKDKHCVCIGAGGAAKAIVYGLIEAGAAIVEVTNRTREKAEEIASQFPDRVRVKDWSEVIFFTDREDFLVNTTALGMSGKPELAIDLKNLPDRAIVTDIVYSPLETKLLSSAKQKGNPIVDGLGMLLYQAVAGFENFFGVKPQVTDELRNVVLG